MQGYLPEFAKSLSQSLSRKNCPGVTDASEIYRCYGDRLQALAIFHLCLFTDEAELTFIFFYAPYNDPASEGAEISSLINTSIGLYHLGQILSPLYGSFMPLQQHKVSVHQVAPPVQLRIRWHGGASGWQKEEWSSNEVVSVELQESAFNSLLGHMLPV